ncbi:hypothetical protein A2U01_0077151, partial [Trifolium medium]|nr:hypothetical protein [Trifolium medium]
MTRCAVDFARGGKASDSGA